MTSYERGDIVLVLFPNTNAEGDKKRPGLIVQNMRIEDPMERTIVACITSSPTVRLTGTRIQVDPTQRKGLPTNLLSKSVIVLDNLASVPLKGIVKRLGKYPFKEEIDTALKLALDLE